MSRDRPFDVAVLAGGRSSRMGTDKAELTLGGQRLLQRQVELAWALAPEEVWVSGRAQGDLGQLRARGLPDEVPDQGPLGGLATVLRATRAPHLLVMAVDMPALTRDFLDRLLERRADGVGVVPRAQQRWQGTLAVYPRALGDVARAQLEHGRRSLQAFVDAGVAARRLVAWDLDPGDEPRLANWNAPGDVAGAS